jgi:hypothetical protein
MIKAARSELRNPPIRIPETKKSAIIIVHAFTINVNNPNVIILIGKVTSSIKGFSKRFTISSTRPIISKANVLPI